MKYPPTKADYEQAKKDQARLHMLEQSQRLKPLQDKLALGIILHLGTIPYDNWPSVAKSVMQQLEDQMPTAVYELKSILPKK